MLFNSLEFLIFFPVVTALYFALRWRLRVWMLLVASTLFYMAFIPKYVLIIYFTIVVDYAAGLLIEQSQGHRRKVFLVASIITNVGALAVFKYWNFFATNMNGLFALGGANAHVPTLDIILPIGLSFHTFQAMSYTIEVYRGKQPAERDPAVYALYVLYYPQLVAGPIERPQNIIHQIKTEHPFDADRVAHGFRRMLWGFFKKVVVADRLAVIVNAVYADPRHFPGPALAIATVFFAYQIYADFSGYSDVALGASEVMGIKLMTNFREPYTSASVSEFWSRWHISLSTWFRDYVYIPLGGNRVSTTRRWVNQLLTFLLSGLWHGANWTYVIWGGLNGLFLVLERGVSPKGIPRGTRITTFFLVTFAWIFFRAATVSDAWAVIRGLPHGWGRVMSPAGVMELLRSMWIGPGRFAGTVAVLGVLIAADVWARRKHSDPVDLVRNIKAPLRWSIYYGVATVLVLFGQYGQQQFIYFQF